jgi:DNA-binding MarR family transcriptional regulator
LLLCLRGLLQRAPCQTDRRVIRAVLTDDGQAQTTLAEAVRTRIIAETGEEAFTQLTSILARFAPAAPPAATSSSINP